MADEVEWRPLVSFEDQSPSYVHGFEAGMIWQRMQDGEQEIEVTAHTENFETLRRMAGAGGYDVVAEPSGTEGWDKWAFVRRPRRGPLSIVK